LRAAGTAETARLAPSTLADRNDISVYDPIRVPRLPPGQVAFAPGVAVVVDRIAHLSVV
jgi:hypothetical protein